KQRKCNHLSSYANNGSTNSLIEKQDSRHDQF
ncbi:MAG: hypothetical protein ACI9MF_000447, partial [Gammaproteobacteria bacterium]